MPRALTALRPQDLDFWKFWTGETISSFGTSFTTFALPLLIFRLDPSPLAFAVATACWTLPNLFFGLQIGAIVDRVDRKRLMIAMDLVAAALVASVPLASRAGFLGAWWIFAVIFSASTVGIFFEASEFGALPQLVRKDRLVAANGQIQASFAAAQVLGPLVAGVLVAFLPLETLLFVDAASFLASATTLSLIRRSFNASRSQPTTTIRADIVEGLRYVLSHPVLRNISIMMALINFIAATRFAQIVLLAKERYAATDSEVGLLFGAGGIGVVLCSLAAGPLRRRSSFGNVALGALILAGATTTAMALVPWFWAAVPLWALGGGLGTLFNINTGSLRQAIVPDHMLGRIITIARVLAWSATPLGAVIGGFAIQWTGDIALVYAVVGALEVVVALYFRVASPLGHAERYLEPNAVSA